MAHSDKVFLPAGRRLKVSQLMLSSEFERGRAGQSERPMSLRGDSFQSSSTAVSVPAEDTVMDLSQFNTSICDFFQINEYIAKQNVKQCNY